jgi:hypothetical protein
LGIISCILCLAILAFAERRRCVARFASASCDLPHPSAPHDVWATMLSVYRPALQNSPLVRNFQGDLSDRYVNIYMVMTIPLAGLVQELTINQLYSEPAGCCCCQRHFLPCTAIHRSVRDVFSLFPDDLKADLFLNDVLNRRFPSDILS